tara:strand:+ start:1182 stop:1616 length:435 start_codon:yes stop_codon:yes gene_type:complete
MKLIIRTIVYIAVLASCMVLGAVIGAVLSFIIMVAAQGAGHHVDVSMLLILGFNALSIKVCSLLIPSVRFGYICCVFIPATAWYLLAVAFGKQHIFTGWHLQNAIASVVIVSFLYMCGYLINNLIKKSNVKPQAETPASSSPED